MMNEKVKGVLSRCETWHIAVRYVAYCSAKGALSHCERCPLIFLTLMSFTTKRIVS